MWPLVTTFREIIPLTVTKQGLNHSKWHLLPKVTETLLAEGDRGQSPATGSSTAEGSSTADGSYTADGSSTADSSSSTGGAGTVYTRLQWDLRLQVQVGVQVGVLMGVLVGVQPRLLGTRRRQPRGLASPRPTVWCAGSPATQSCPTGREGYSVGCATCGGTPHVSTCHRIGSG